MSDDKTDGFDIGGLGGAFKGLGDMIEKLAELADAGDGSHGGEFGGDKEGVKGVWGVRVNTIGGEDDAGGSSWSVEPFGDVHQSDDGEVAVAPVREPLVDVFEEEDGVRLVAEMPGVGVEDVRCEIDGDVFRVSAKHGEKRYFKELLLPQSFEQPAFEVTANNGVVEMMCRNA